MNADERQRLDDWTEHLADALGVDNEAFRAAVDIDALLNLAGAAAHAILRPAAPLTTFLVGYAAALAVSAGTPPTEALLEAMDTATQAASQATL